MLTFSFGATFLFFLIPQLKIIFFFLNHFFKSFSFFLRSRFLFLFAKKKEIIIIIIVIYIIIYIIIKRDENRSGEKKTHWRGKKSGGEGRNRGAIKKSQ